MKAAIAGIDARVRRPARGASRSKRRRRSTSPAACCSGPTSPPSCATLDALPIDVIGLNCSTGPAHMRDAVRYLVENSRCFVSVIPNAGLPLMGPHGETIYPETPQ